MKKSKEKLNMFILRRFISKIIVEIFLFFIGLLIFGINIGWAIRSIIYTETTATIYKVIYDENLNSYRPIYEYNFNNRKFRVKGNVIGEKKDFIIGDKVTIIYNPKNFNKFSEGSKKDAVFVWIGCVICLTVSSISLYLAIKKIKKYQEHRLDFNGHEEDAILEE